MSEPHIRQAQGADHPAIVALIRALADFERLPAPSDEEASRLFEHGFGPRPHFESLVAELDGAVVAYAIFFTTYSTFRARPTLFLEDLFVHPDARRRKIATRMMQHLHGLARSRGCGRFEWFVLDWNVDAQKLYEGLGARRLDDWRLCRIDL